ncbi:MAG: hypothetical protein A3J79_14700 [Elusimicrobia bacterium RIFOXYB2_FULL_62_6]|nr:MAG: hypothetical protein A3J79_14700 [Elusimicrobia bacterium RIFOXYB2_FULL_62_6]
MIIEDLEKAEELEEKGEVNAAFTLLKKTGCPKGFEGRWYYLTGEAWRLKGVFQKAIAAYRSALLFGVPNSGLFCQALIRTAACHRALGREKQAFAFAAAAVKASRKAPALASEAKLELAMAHRLRGDFKKAASMLAPLLKAYLAEKDYPAAAFILWALGGLYRLQGRYALSIEAFHLSGSYAAKAGDESSRGYALFGLGGVLRVAGFMKPARHAYIRARTLFHNTEDTFARAYAECGLANVLRQEGELDAAQRGYLLARKLYSEIGDKPDLGFVEWGLGEVYKKTGRFRDAMACFKAAKRLFEGNGEPRGEILTGLSMASVHYLEGRTAEADLLYFDAVARAKKHGLHTYLETFT